MRKLALVFGIGLTLAACAKQTPAPVVSGYDGKNRDVVIDTAKHENNLQAVNRGIEESRSVKQAQTYMVQPGDNLHQIASHFRVNRSDLAEQNGMKSSDVLRVGQILIIPTDGVDVDEKVGVKSRSDGGQYRLTRDRNIVVVPPKAGEIVKATPVAEDKTAAAMAKVEKPVVVPPEKQNPAPVINKAQQVDTGYLHHKVRRGENLFRIGLKYKVSPLDLLSLNNMDKPEELQAGQVIKVPLQRGDAVKEHKTNERAAQSEGFMWPVQGRIIKSFGVKGEGVNNTGINIAAKAGTPILAAGDGTVIYAAGGLKSFGNLILLRHRDGLITAYAHNNENLVKRNEYVAKGQVIGYVGKSGNVDVPQLHFEVRRNARAINPVKILP